MYCEKQRSRECNEIAFRHPLQHLATQEVQQQGNSGVKQ